MARNPTKVSAIQISPGATVLVDPGKDLLGAVTLHDQIFLVVAEFDREPPPAAPPAADAPAAPQDPPAGDPVERLHTRRKRE